MWDPLFILFYFSIVAPLPIFMGWVYNLYYIKAITFNILQLNCIKMGNTSYPDPFKSVRGFSVCIIPYSGTEGSIQ